MDALPYLIPILTGGGLTAILVRVRLMLRDKRELDLARHVFDQTRSTDGLDGYARVIQARKGKGSPPPPEQPSTDVANRLEIEG